jgi:hypothetical protein
MHICPLQQYFSYTDKYIDGGNKRTVKPADVVTPIKQSPVFKGHTNRIWLRLMVFNATFNNISVIS